MFLKQVNILGTKKEHAKKIREQKIEQIIIQKDLELVNAVCPIRWMEYRKDRLRSSDPSYLF